MNLFAVLALPVCFLFYLFVIYHYLVPRENCKTKVILCLAGVFLLHLLSRICQLSTVSWVEEYNIAKLLTILSVFLLTFGCGMFIYGGWAQIGLLLIAVELIFAFYERTYWQTWGYFARATAEEIAMRAQVLAPDPVTLLEMLSEAAVAALFLIPAKKVRKYNFGRLPVVKAVVLIYLLLGSMPAVAKPGFENGYPQSTFIFFIVDLLMFFFAAMTILWKMQADSRQLLQLRQYAFAAQTQALDTQRQKMRRFRHDIKRHLDAMSYLTKTRPELEQDPSFLQYRQELERYRDIFQQNTYCDSDELNAGISQIDQFCAANGIPCEIRLRRITFGGWKKEEMLEFGTLLYNLVAAVDKTDRRDSSSTQTPRQQKADSAGIGTQAIGAPTGSSGIAGLRISGDEVQGQNILNIETEYRGGEESIPCGNGKTDNKSTTLQFLHEEIRKILARHKGSLNMRNTENGSLYSFIWDKADI